MWSFLISAIIVINELMASNAGEVMSPATNFDSWIELYNPTDQAIDLGGMYLSDNAADLKKWQMPKDMGTVPAHGFKVVWLGSNDILTNQAPFKLDCDGGTVYLSDKSGETLASQAYPTAMSRTAYARTTDGGDEWGWTSTATPGTTNATAVFASQRLDPPVVDTDSRLFTGSLVVKVDIPENTILMYTTDGSVPTAPKNNGEQQVSPWTNWVTNGDCEGDDVTCLVGKDGDENGKFNTKIVEGSGYNHSRGIKVHSVARAAEEWTTQFFVYTPDHIWNAGDKYRFKMKVRADKAARISVQSHRTPGDYIHWQMLADNYDVGTDWREIVYEGTITNEQAGTSDGGWWWGEPVQSELQTIAFNLNIDKSTANNFYFDDISWESYQGEGEPASQSLQSLDGKFTFNATTNLCLRLFREGYLPSVPVTRSYIQTANKYPIPVISIVGDKRYFSDPKIGIDCDGDGTNGRTGNGQDYPRNYNQPWDRPVNFSYISPEGKMLINQDVNISVSGGWTRAQAVRSFKLKANKVFDGLNRFDFSFFPQKPYIRNKAILLRNGGNDVWVHSARFMDPALETIIQRSGIDLDLQSYVPVIEYVNGNLRGVLNLRETNNDKYVYANYGYDEEEIDFLENFEMKNGDDKAIKRIFELGAHINEPGAYDELKNLLDIDEFTNYMAVELYVGNEDWPDNNIKAYRSKKDGRYRFISYDLDYAFGLRYNTANDNPFTFFESFSDLPFVSFFLNLLRHDEFRKHFIDTYCIIAGSVFEKNRANEIVDELLDFVKPIIQQYDNRYDPTRSANTIKSKLQNRLTRMITCMQDFKLMQLSRGKKHTVQLKSDTEGTHLYINGHDVPYANFNGTLFDPVILEAKAPAGYRFAGWKSNGNILSTEAIIDLPSTTAVSLTATFESLSDEELSASGVTPVRINEVSANNGIYVNEYFKRNDWIELYNTTDAPIDVEGMYLSDNPSKPLKYQITKGESNASTVIPAHGYLVIWCDKLEPVSQLHAFFKLAAEGGELTLTANDESWTDRLTYTTLNSDQTAGRYPDGTADVIVMNVPTIAKANLTSSYAEDIAQTNDGIRDILASTTLSIGYALGTLTIRGADDDALLQVSITNVAGQNVARQAITSSAGLAEMTVTHLPSGVYIATAVDGKGQKVSCKFAAGRE